MTSMLRWACCLVIVAGGALAPVPGAAQGLVQKLFTPSSYGTTSAKFEPVMADGQLIGCRLNFSAVIQDHIHRQGEPITVSGGIGVQAINGDASGTLKIVVQDMVLIRRGIGKVPSVPYSAHLRSAAGVTSIASERAKPPTDTPGGLLVEYRIDKPFAAILAEVSSSGRVAIVFKRLQAGRDLVVDVDFAVVEIADTFTQERRRSRQSIADFSDCMTKVLK